MVAIVCTLLASLFQTTGNGVLAGWLKAREHPDKHRPILRSPLALVVAIAFLAGHFFTWYWIVSWATLSFVVPFTAVGYLYNAFLAKLLFHEHISPKRWLGIVCILIGFVVVCLTGGES